jgi:microfibrillar-associated protein 1
MDDLDESRFNRRYNEVSSTFGVHSTAGAVPVRNKKGEISMQKVKVQRYISGKKPDYARGKISDSEEEER